MIEDNIHKKIDDVIDDLRSVGMDAKEMEDFFKLSMVEYYYDKIGTLAGAAKNAGVSKRCFYNWYNKELS